MEEEAELHGQLMLLQLFVLPGESNSWGSTSLDLISLLLPVKYACADDCDACGHMNSVWSPFFCSFTDV